MINSKVRRGVPLQKISPNKGIMSTQIPEAAVARRETIEVVPGEYCVKLDEKPYMLFRFTFTLDRAGSGLKHPNVLGRLPCTLEFKHYRNGGSKFWSSRPGVDIYVAVDKMHVRLVLEKTWSYPKLRIGNAEFTTSVGGGGSPWAELLSSPVSTFTNIKLATLLEICRLAMTPQQAKAAGVALPAVETDNTAFLANALARMGSSKRLAPGNKVILLPDFSFRNSQEVDFVSWRNGQKMVCSREGFSIWISLCRIDWVKTAQANNISVRTPTDLVYNGIESLAA
jgi:hypothetical protein